MLEENTDRMNTVFVKDYLNGLDRERRRRNMGDRRNKNFKYVQASWHIAPVV
jgi:hypothetical protein